MKALPTWPKFCRRWSASWMVTVKAIFCTSAGTLRQIDHDHLVVTLAGTGPVIAGVLHRATGGF
jgi:hypothetical protein